MGRLRSHNSTSVSHRRANLPHERQEHHEEQRHRHHANEDRARPADHVGNTGLPPKQSATMERSPRGAANRATPASRCRRAQAGYPESTCRRNWARSRPARRRKAHPPRSLSFFFSVASAIAETAITSTSIPCRTVRRAVLDSDVPFEDIGGLPGNNRAEAALRLALAQVPRRAAPGCGRCAARTWLVPPTTIAPAEQRSYLFSAHTRAALSSVVGR